MGISFSNGGSTAISMPWSLFRLKDERKRADDEALYFAGLFLLYLEKADKAREYVDRLLKINPNSVDGLNLKGWVEVTISVFGYYICLVIIPDIYKFFSPAGKPIIILFAFHQVSCIAFSSDWFTVEFLCEVAKKDRGTTARGILSWVGGLFATKAIRH